MIRARIIKRLKEVGMTRADLARRAGIAPQTATNFLNGQRPLPLEKLERVMEILGL